MSQLCFFSANHTHVHTHLLNSIKMKFYPQFLFQKLKSSVTLRMCKNNHLIYFQKGICQEGKYLYFLQAQFLPHIFLLHFRSPQHTNIRNIDFLQSIGVISQIFHNFANYMFSLVELLSTFLIYLLICLFIIKEKCEIQEFQ